MQTFMIILPYIGAVLCVALAVTGAWIFLRPQRKKVQTVEGLVLTEKAWIDLLQKSSVVVEDPVVGAILIKQLLSVPDTNFSSLIDNIAAKKSLQVPFLLYPGVAVFSTKDTNQ